MRKASVIGILLEIAREREFDAPEATQPSTLVYKIVNIRDCHGIKALYYACASAKPESVALLLYAGASVQSDTYNTSVWQAVVDFEEEVNCGDSLPPETFWRQLVAS